MTYTLRVKLSMDPASSATESYEITGDAPFIWEEVGVHMCQPRFRELTVRVEDE
jgi:hypothetical protein